jgi:UDPglucose--hexose-1-phosphate uridylyltransferase
MAKPGVLTPYQMTKTPVGMDDGRTLNYYDFAPIGSSPEFLALHQNAAKTHPAPGPRTMEKPSEMRWNPTLGEWTIYAAHRMNRPMLPSPDACPLCPGILEIPQPYQIAVFENRAPALGNLHLLNAPEPDDAGAAIGLSKIAHGHCDMVVYSQNHNAKLASLSANEVLFLVEAWRDRYAQLIQNPGAKFVAIMENKEREAGMTLDHPHGQIYVFPFLPPLVQKQYQVTLDAPELWDRILENELESGARVITQTEGFVAAMPFYARYPYEIHIWARRAGVCSLLEMTPQERRELAGVLRNIAGRYENLWPNAKYRFPTLMLLQQLTNVAGAENFRFHIEFFPLQRSPDKLKYRASIETGTGAFLNDALPEAQAEELRQTAPCELELPEIIFEK